MSIKNQLEIALKKAMKENNTLDKNVLRVLLTNLKLLEVEKGSELTDTEIITVIQKDIKQHQETIELATSGNRQDIIDQAKNELKILETYLPPQLSDEELKELIVQCINEIHAESLSDSGKVLKILMPKIAGRASGSKASNLVRELLTKHT